MIEKIKFYNDKLNNYLKDRNIFKYDENNFNIKNFNIQMNHFCDVFGTCLNLLSEYFENEYNLKICPINNRLKIIEKSFEYGLINNEMIWRKFLGIFNYFYENESYYNISRFIDDSKKDLYLENIEFIYKSYNEFEYLVKNMNREIKIIENNIKIL